MLESGLFFALGFFLAILIALLIAPAIWRRAVAITQKQIEDSVPLSLEEIQASKDQLRAKFAKDTRKLESNIEVLQTRSAEQLIELSRNRDEMLVLEDKVSNQTTRIAELEATNLDLARQLQKNEERLSETEAKLTQVDENYKETLANLQELEERYHGAVDEFDGQKIDMIARETRMDGLLDEMREIKKTAKETGSERDQILKELKAADITVEREQTRNADLEARLTELQASFADMESRLERRDADLKKLRGENGSSRLDTLLRENESLHEEIAALKNRGHNAGADQSDIAAVRDQISELAARVTAAAAAQEGPESPILQALNDKQPANATKSSARGKTVKAASTGKKRTAKPGTSSSSLADKIRSLQ